MSAPISSAQPTRPADENPKTRPSFTYEIAVIALGGSLGAGLRHAVALAMSAADWHPVFATATANVLGSLGLGLLLGFVESDKSHPLLRPFLTIGVFGSFTTFSALALDLRLVAAESGETLAALHLAASILAGLLAFIFGDRLSARVFEAGRS